MTRCGRGNLGKAVGPVAIEELLIRTMEVYPSDLERTYHLVMNEQIDVDGDTATARSSWGYVTRSESDAPVFEMLGRYRDDLRRTRRRLAVLAPCRLQRHPLHLPRRDPLTAVTRS